MTTGNELYVPVRNDFAGDPKEQSFDALEKTLKRCFRAIEDWAESPFVASAHIQDATITAAHIEDASITDAKITSLSADKLTAGTLNADVLLAAKMRTGDPGSRRVEMDTAGVRLLDTDDSLVVSLPTDADQPAYFAGTVVAQELVLSSSTGLTGTLNVDINGGTIAVAASASDPSAAPAVYSSTGSASFPVQGTFTGTVLSTEDTLASWASRRGLWFDGTRYWYVTYGAGASGTVLVSRNTSGTILSWTNLRFPVSSDTPSGAAGWMSSAVYVSPYWYSLDYDGNLSVFSTTTSDLGSECYNPSGLTVPHTVVNTKTVSGISQSSVGYLTTDGTDLYIAVPSATSDVVSVQKWSAGSSPALVSSVNCTTTLAGNTSKSVVGFYRGSGDLGATRNILLVSAVAAPTGHLQSGGHYYVYNTSGTRQSSEEWTAVAAGGLVYRSGTFYEMSSTAALIYSYYGASGGFGTSTYQIAYTFYDSNATGGTHESALSPRAAVTGAARRALQVTWPALPTGGTDDANSVRLYVKLSASDPGTTFSSYYRQGSTYTGTTTTLTSYSTGTVGSQDTAFPNSGSPGEITSGLGGFSLKGDGTMLLPQFSADPTGAAGQIYYNTTTNKARVHNGTSWFDLF